VASAVRVPVRGRDFMGGDHDKRLSDPGNLQRDPA